MTTDKCGESAIPAECGERFARIETKLDMLLERQKTLGRRVWDFVKGVCLLALGALLAWLKNGKG